MYSSVHAASAPNLDTVAKMENILKEYFILFIFILTTSIETILLF